MQENGLRDGLWFSLQKSTQNNIVVLTNVLLRRSPLVIWFTSTIYFLLISMPTECVQTRSITEPELELLRLWHLKPHNKSDDPSPPQLQFDYGGPRCRHFSRKQCPRPSVCDCDAIAPFYREVMNETTPSHSGKSLSELRVFFLDGHTGPMNDMASFMNEVLAIPSNHFDLMIFMQARVPRSFSLCHAPNVVTSRA